MRYLFSARHGHYEDRTGDLTSKGLEQISELANSIRNITDSNSLCMSYAGERRVAQTAEALARNLRISDSRFIEWDQSLIKDTYSIRGDLVLEAYDSWAEKYLAMIFVSHELPTIHNAHKLAEKMGFDKKILERLERMGLNEGKAICLDLEQKIFKIIPMEISTQKVKKVQSYQNIDLAF